MRTSKAYCLLRNSDLYHNVITLLLCFEHLRTDHTWYHPTFLRLDSSISDTFLTVKLKDSIKLKHAFKVNGSVLEKDTLFGPIAPLSSLSRPSPTFFVDLNFEVVF